MVDKWITPSGTLKLESEYSYPYEGKDGSCRYHKQNKAVFGTIVRAYTEFKRYDNEALNTDVATVGTVSIGVSVANLYFLHYGGGVFNGNTGNPRIINHGILLVGYGSVNGKDFWLVKNSWSWGEEGFMRLTSAKKNDSVISTKANHPILQ